MAAALITLMFSISLAGCDGGSNGGSNPPTPATTGSNPPQPEAAGTSTANTNQFGDPATNEVGPPQIHFEKETHNFGTISETDDVTTTFAFSNTGKGTLVIEEVKPTCTCTGVAIDKTTLRPGESGTISVRFRPSSTGKQNKLIHVASNDFAQPRVTISVQAEVEAFIVFEPKHVELGTIQPGTSRSAYVSVLSPDEGMRVVRVTATNPNVAVRIVQASTADATAPLVGLPGQALIEVSVTDQTPWGPVFSWINVLVEGTPPGKDAPQQHTRQFRINAQVFGDLVADPDTFRAGARPGEKFTRIVNLKRVSGQPFKIFQATIGDIDNLGALPRTQMQVHKVSDSEYNLQLDGYAGDEINSFNGVVYIKTDVPGEEEIQIKISGRVIGPAG